MLLFFKTNMNFIKHNKNILYSILFLFIIGIIFWLTSRYPDLFAELFRAQDNTLLDRSISPLSKSEMILTAKVPSFWEQVFDHAINWIETNIKGMSFGILFAAGILSLMQQWQWLRLQSYKEGIIGSIAGTLFGFPLGVCSNCTAPIGLSLKKSGASSTSAIATMIASPTLNPVGLTVILMLFPTYIATARILFPLFLLLVILPVLAKILKLKNNNKNNINTEYSCIAEICDTHISGFKIALKYYFASLYRIIKWVVPLMLLTAIVSGIFLALIPIDTIFNFRNSPYLLIIVAALIGVILPAPMFLDIILSYSLYTLGLLDGATVALLLTLGPISIFSGTIIYKYISKISAVLLAIIIYLTATIVGFAYHYYDSESNKVRFVAVFSDPNPTKDFLNKKLKVLDFLHMPGRGVSFVDIDNDNDDDIWVSNFYGGRLYRNDGNFKFTDITKNTGIVNNYNNAAAICADYNNDGYQDLYLVNYANYTGDISKTDDNPHGYIPQPNKLYRNNGDGTFTDVTMESGLDHNDYSISAAWGDINNDGYLDLYVTNYNKFYNIYQDPLKQDKIRMESKYNQLYLNNKDGSFTDISDSSGTKGNSVDVAFIDTDVNIFEQLEEEFKQSVVSGFSFQPVFFDFNNDNLIDLFVANDFGLSLLYKNLGNNKFKDVTYETGALKNNYGMGVLVFDYNHDGLLDLYETSLLGSILWENHKGKFTEAKNNILLNGKQSDSWGVLIIDADNNGIDELLVANGIPIFNVGNDTKKYNFNAYYQKDSDNMYQNKSLITGFYNTYASRGLATSDLNNDGYPEVFIMNQNADNKLLSVNALKNNWLKIKLKGTVSNLDAVGAVITVISGNKKQTRLVNAGSSYASQNSLTQIFGLGKYDKVDEIIIKWPSGIIQKLNNITVNNYIKVTENIDKYVVL